MSAEDVLAWAARRRVTGRLLLERPGVARTLWLSAGAAVWEASDVPHEQLGQTLVRSGVVGAEQLARALEARRPGDVEFGLALVLHGAIPERELAALLAVKIRESVCEAVTWADGWFDFQPGDAPSSRRVDVAVELAPALELARARLPRWAAIRAAIPGDATGFSVSEPTGVRLAAAGRLDGARLLAVISGGGTAGDAIAALAGERYAVLDVLCELVERGLAVAATAPRGHAGEPPPRGRASPPPVRAATSVAATVELRLAAGDRAGALALAADGLAAAPADPQAQALWERARRARVAELARALLAPGATPALAVEAAALAAQPLTDVERHLVGRIDGRWDALTLVATAPAGPAAALHALAALAGRGIVALR